MSSEKSNKAISKNIGELVHSYKKTGKIGTSHPESIKDAQKQASAIVLSKAGKSRKKKKMKKFLESLKTPENQPLLETIERGLMICLENMESNMSIEDATKIASQWHGGEDSELFLFASMGKIHDKQKLLEEIEGTLNAIIVADNIDPMDKEIRENELLDLKDFVESSLGQGLPRPDLMESVSYTYKGTPVEVVKNNGMDEEYSTEIWTVKTQDGKTFDVKSRDLKFGTSVKLPSKLFDVSTAPQFVEALKSKVNAAFKNAYQSTLGGPEHVSVMFGFSLQPKEQWSNSIYHNSPYSNFSLHNDGVLEQISSHLNKRFRKCRVKSVEDLVNKINNYIKEVSV